MIDKEQFVAGMMLLIEKCLGTNEDNSESRNIESENTKDSVSVVKSVNEELKQATFLVLSPDEPDLHGDIYDAEEIRKGCHNFNLHCRKADLFHLMETDLAEIVESYIALDDLYLNDQFVKKGSWLQVFQFNDEDLWGMVKSGEINGASIQCNAYAEDI